MAIGTVKYIVGILTGDPALKDQVIGHLSELFGECDYIGNWYPFTHTNFYAAEMGPDLKRCFVSFKKLTAPELLGQAKLWCSEVEDRFKEDGRRRVNLDPGYVDYFKVVLASGKFGGHKIAVTKGCWADFIMMYSKGKWHPMPWCFPDFAQGTYDRDLTKIRRLFKKGVNPSPTQ